MPALPPSRWWRCRTKHKIAANAKPWLYFQIDHPANDREAWREARFRAMLALRRISFDLEAVRHKPETLKASQQIDGLWYYYDHPMGATSTGQAQLAL